MLHCAYPRPQAADPKIKIKISSFVLSPTSFPIPFHSLTAVSPFSRPQACAARPGCASFDFNPEAGSVTTAPNCWLHADTRCVRATNGRVRISGVMCNQSDPGFCKSFTCPPGPPSPGPGPSPRPPTPPAPFPPPCPGCPSLVKVGVEINPTVIHTVLPEYASVDLDYWHNTTMSGGDWVSTVGPRMPTCCAAAHLTQSPYPPPPLYSTVHCAVYIELLLNCGVG